MNTPSIDAQIRALMEEVYRLTGYDFRQYAPASRRRRVMTFIGSERLPGVAELQERLRRAPESIDRLVRALAVPATAMFRDPPFFRALRERLIPKLATYPSVRVWVAGCATGEEAWSMAIVLREEGLHERARIYATDMSAELLSIARHGRLPLATMHQYAQNYLEAGGTDFGRHCQVKGDLGVLDPALRQNIVFAQHNLAVDAAFNEFQLILCRNVLIYFEDALKQRVYRLFSDSLAPLGVLALGATEALPTGRLGQGFDVLDAQHRWYRKASTAVREYR